MMVTFLIQIEIEGGEGYLKRLNTLQDKLEKMGFSVNLEDESLDEGEEDFNDEETRN